MLSDACELGADLLGVVFVSVPGIHLGAMHGMYRHRYLVMDWLELGAFLYLFMGTMNSFSVVASWFILIIVTVLICNAASTYF